MEETRYIQGNHTKRVILGDEQWVDCRCYLCGIGIGESECFKIKEYKRKGRLTVPSFPVHEEPKIHKHIFSDPVHFVPERTFSISWVDTYPTRFVKGKEYFLDSDCMETVNKFMKKLK